MNFTTLSPFHVIGLSIETSNDPAEGGPAMQKLWNDFFELGVPARVPNKVSEEILSIYTDYESDFQGRYTAVLGYKVDSLENIDEGLVGRSFEGGKHQPFLAKGEMPQSVIQTWAEIWAQDAELNRAYTADFEVYGAKSQAGADSEVEIFIAVK